MQQSDFLTGVMTVEVFIVLSRKFHDVKHQLNRIVLARASREILGEAKLKIGIGGFSVEKCPFDFFGISSEISVMFACEIVKVYVSAHEVLTRLPAVH